MQQAASNVDVLGNADNVKIMSNILKTNVSACTSIGSFFLPQLGRIWLDMLGLYKAVSGIISEQVATQGKLPLSDRLRVVASADILGLVATKTPKVRSLRTIKKEILKLVETYVKKAEDLDGVNQNLIPGLLDAILGDYNRNVPAARDAEVLNVVATIVSKLGVSCDKWTGGVAHKLTDVVSARSPDWPYPGCGLRAHTRDDQPGLCRVSGAPRRLLQASPGYQLDLLRL